MKSLDTKATLIIKKLYEAMYNKPYMIEKGYARIDNTDGLYMPVVIESIGNIKGMGDVISIAHYGKLNGDPMRDPEMTFVIIGGDYYPISFRNDYIGLDQEVLTFNDDGTPAGIRPKLQAELASFANTWLKNISEQQNL